MTTTSLDPVERLAAQFDHHDPEFTPDVAREVHTRIRDNSVIAYSAAHGGMWIFSHYRHVKTAMRDHRTFSNGSGVFFPRAPGTPRFAPLDFDQPEHTTYRTLMKPPFAHQQVPRLTRRVAEITAELVQPIVARGHGDFAVELATPLTLRAIAMAVGLTDDAQRQIRALTSNLWEHLPKDRDPRRFWPQFAAMLSAEITRARRQPGDDYLSRLVRRSFDGRPITDDELHSILVAYCIGGHQSSMNTISHMLCHLARAPWIQAALKDDPSLIPAAVDEAMRLWTPNDHLTRVTTREVTLDGVTIPAGARIMLLIGAANRDPDVFGEPEEFRLDRELGVHLEFGFGIHFCIGAPLAKIEFAAVLQELARHPRYRLDGEPRRYFENGHHITFGALPVRFGEAGADVR
ncbi:MAG TPA: cytochrome P450 [Streptosporangiaceae bacterium]|nr:cytochrome P450 [Streptosporangiaceae bacterium]